MSKYKPRKRGKTENAIAEMLGYNRNLEQDFDVRFYDDYVLLTVKHTLTYLRGDRIPVPKEPAQSSEELI